MLFPVTGSTKKDPQSFTALGPFASLLQAGLVADIEKSDDVSLKIELCQGDGIRKGWRSWNFAKQSKFAKLAEIKDRT